MTPYAIVLIVKTGSNNHFTMKDALSSPTFSSSLTFLYKAPSVRYCKTSHHLKLHVLIMNAITYMYIYQLYIYTYIQMEANC